MLLLYVSGQQHLRCNGPWALLISIEQLRRIFGHILIAMSLNPLQDDVVSVLLQDTPASKKRKMGVYGYDKT